MLSSAASFQLAPAIRKKNSLLIVLYIPSAEALAKAEKLKTSPKPFGKREVFSLKLIYYPFFVKIKFNWPGSQVVRQLSAKELYAGAIPAQAFL